MENKCCCGTRLCSPALGLALGIVSGLSMMLFAWASWQWGVGTTLMTEYASMFHGYEASLIGGVWGGLWGFIEGLVMGLIIGWVYNCVARCCKCCKSCACCNNKAGSCAK